MWLQFSKKVADGSERKFAVTESKFLPRCQNPQFCGFAPRGKLVGECLPQTLLIVLADCISFTSAPARKFIHSVARPLPTQPASLGLRGDPMSAAHERRSHYAKEIQHTPPQPRCENPAVRRRIRRLHSAACALWYQPVRISPAGNTAGDHTPRCPCVGGQYELLSAVGKLTAEYGRIGGSLNQIARYLNEYGVPYHALSGEIRATIADLAAHKYEVLKKVGDVVGNTQAFRL